MAKAIAVVGARLNSSRLPGKQLLDLAGKPLIARVFERLSKCAEIDKAILATTDDPYNRPLIDWAVSSGIAVFAFQGDVNDLVARVDAVVSNENADIVVYVCGDSPLIEPATLETLIRENQKAGDFDWVELDQPKDGRYIHEGFSVYPRKLWQLIVDESNSADDKEHVGSVLKCLRSRLRIRSIEDDSIFSSIQHRISVDTPSDYIFMCEAYKRWYLQHTSEKIVSLKWLIGELKQDQALSLVNKQVRQKKVGEQSVPVLLVCQVGATIGLGHLTRCMALAKAMQDQYFAGVRLLIQGEPVQKAGLSLLPHGFIDAELDLVGAVSAELKKRPCAAVVFDLHSQHIPKGFDALLEELGEGGIVRIGIDSLSRFSGATNLVDLLCLPGFYAPPKMLASCKPTPVRFGWQYYLIEQRKELSAKQSIKDSVLVLTGGADTTRLGLHLPAKLDAALPLGVTVIWVQGPFAQPPTLPDNPRLDWQVEEAPTSLADLMDKCSVALTVYGVSLFELFAQGVPTVVFSPYAARDDAELLALSREKSAYVATSEDDAVFGISLLLKNKSEAQRLACRGPQLVDGFGPARLAGDIFALISESSAQ